MSIKGLNREATSLDPFLKLDMEKLQHTVIHHLIHYIKSISHVMSPASKEEKDQLARFRKKVNLATCYDVCTAASLYPCIFVSAPQCLPHPCQAKPSQLQQQGQS